MDIWKILEIEPTKDIREIKKAYSRLIKIYHPEDDIDAYERVRYAYAAAMEYAKSSQDRVDEKEIATKENEIDLNQNQSGLDFDTIYHTSLEREEKEVAREIDFSEVYQQTEEQDREVYQQTEEQERIHQEREWFKQLTSLKSEVRSLFHSPEHNLKQLEYFLSSHQQWLEEIYITLLEEDFYGIKKIEVYQLLGTYVENHSYNISPLIRERVMVKISQVYNKRRQQEKQKEVTFKAKINSVFQYGQMIILGIILSIILLSSYVKTHWMNLEDIAYSRWTLYIMILSGLCLYQMIRSWAVVFNPEYGIWSKGLKAYVYMVLPIRLALFFFLLAAGIEDRGMGATIISILIGNWILVDEIWFSLSVDKGWRYRGCYRDFFRKLSSFLVAGSILLEISYIVVVDRLVNDVSGMSIIGIIILCIHQIRVYRGRGILWMNYILHILAGIIVYQGIICSQLLTTSVSEEILLEHEGVIVLGIMCYIFLASINFIVSLILKLIKKSKEKYSSSTQ